MSEAEAERDVRRALAARAAALVLGVVVFWSIVAGLAAALEYGLVDVRSGVLPSFATRATVLGGAALMELVVLLLVVRLASGEPRAGSRRLTAAGWVALAGVVAVSVGGAAASVWLPFKTTTAIAGLGSARLGEWTVDTATLACVGLGLRIAVAVVGLAYGVIRWQVAERRLERAATRDRS